jgi:ribosomal protein S18 acetylase RimI-like enzyme
MLPAVEPQVTPIGEATTAEVAGVLGRAFADNPGFRALLCDSEDALRLRQTLRGMRFAVAAARRCGVAEVVRMDGKVAAVALRFRPGEYPLRLDGMALMVGMGLSAGPRAAIRYARLDRFMSRFHPRGRHHYLYFLGVEPASQGRGLGGALLRRMNAVADADGVDCYLETDVLANVRLYERHGYRVDAERSVPGLRGLRLWSMTRPASGGG